MTEYLDSSLIKKNIDNQGYHCIDDYISDEELNTLKEFVNKKLEENNNQYFFLTSENPEKTLLNDNFSLEEHACQSIMLRNGDTINFNQIFFKNFFLYDNPYSEILPLGEITTFFFKKKEKNNAKKTV